MGEVVRKLLEQGNKETSQIAVVTGECKINGDNLNNIICEASRHSRNKEREYLKDKINELTTII
jgi:hypothetical protein